MFIGVAERLLVLLACVHGYQSLECASQELSYHPHESDPDSFYVCNEGQLNLLSCPSGYTFNLETTRCVPNRCNEESCDTRAMTKDTCTEMPTCYPNEVGVLKPYPPDCSKYIYCESGVAYLSSCPFYYEFSAEYSFCMEPVDANCTQCVETTTTLPTCVETPMCLTQEDVNTYKPYPPDCRRYIYCDDNLNAVISYCPYDYLFSPTRFYCTVPDDSDCSFCIESTTIDVITMVPCAETPVCLSEADINTYKPYPPDCRRYIYCDNYLSPILSYCPFDHLFSPSLLMCTKPALSDCPVCTTPTIGPCPETPTCGQNDTGLLKPYPADCSMFIYCEGPGDGQLSYCPAGQHFSPTASTCMSAEVANCLVCEPGTTVITTPAVCPDVPTCQGHIEGDVLPYPPDCRQFLYCDAFGQAVLSYCPFELHFNPVTLICEDSEDAMCPFCLEASTTETTRFTLKPTTEVSGPSTITLKPTADITAPTITLKPTTDVTGPSTITLKPTTQVTTDHSTMTLKPTTEVTQPSTITLKPTTDVSGPSTITLKSTSENIGPSTVTLKPTSEVTGASTVTLKPTTGVTEPSTITLKPSTDFTTPSTVTLKPIIELCPETPTCYPNYTDVLVPFPPNCSQYINCNGTIKILSDCPPGEHFSPLESICMPPEEADCPLCLKAGTTERPIPPTTLPPCPPEQSCDGQPNNARLSFPMDCTLYKRCGKNGETDYWRCPTGKEFSPTTSWCEFPDVANCILCDCPGCTYPPNIGNDTVATFLSDFVVLYGSHYLVQGVEDVMIDDVDDFLHEDD